MPGSMENATLAGWTLKSALRSTTDAQTQDRPNYWAAKPELLLSKATVELVEIGSGLEVYNAMLPEIERADSEVILVTCFWARSATLDALNRSLQQLSDNANRRGRKVRVRICFSSLSLVQKIFHTRSLQGRVYPPTCWVKKLGLPDPTQLTGLDMEIKSIFVLPFSVMHPKFIIIDRQKVFLPSCNVSWETWFEGCIKLSGLAVDQFLYFHKMFWASEEEQQCINPMTKHEAEETGSMNRTLFLPSPHHAFSILDSFSKPTSPPTPLNLFTLEVLVSARRSIYIQTPNLTARPVLDSLLTALSKGVDVQIVTSEKLMILEQIVTARTTTARCVRWLLKQHKKLAQVQRRRTVVDMGEDGQANGIGKLDISFYTPRLDLNPDDPVQSHLKFTLVDDEIVLLGSGNMDRASWVTSQELGVAIFGQQFASVIKEKVQSALEGRLTRARG